MRFVLTLVPAIVLLAGCPAKKTPQPRANAPVLNLWHTFNPQETRTLNQVLERQTLREDGWRVQPTVIPFARAQNKFRRAAERCGEAAPDIFRAEMPWVAEFVSKGLVVPYSGTVSESELLPQARQGARYRGKRWFLPASLDCLALLYNRRLIDKPPGTLDELVAAARRQTIDAAGERPSSPRFDPRTVKRWGFYVRADGYWFLPFLWALGGKLLDPDKEEVFIDNPAAVTALGYYRDLIRKHRVAPPRPSPSNDYEDQMRRFGAGKLAMIVNGPWATSDLLALPAFKDPSRLGVAPFPAGPDRKAAAPLSGHGYVVSRCAKDPAAAWRLAEALSSLEIQVKFARANRLLPALKAAYDDPEVKANALLRGFSGALARSRSRPRHPAIARIFDDFTPAVQAVLLGNAEPKEALEGVGRAWRRLLAPPASAPASAPARGAP